MTTEQTLIQNFEKFKELTEKIGSKGGKIQKFIETNAERILLCPASTKLDYVCAYPGGLVEHSLRVLTFFAKSRTAFGLQDSISSETAILLSLFHDIGKIGTDSKEYYIENDSQWHKDKLGQMYNISERLQHIPVSQLTLMHLVSADVKLEVDEWFAISSIRDRAKKDDLPTDSEPMVSAILHNAVKMAIMTSKGQKSAVLIGAGK